jgi:hypothetical protein
VEGREYVALQWMEIQAVGNERDDIEQVEKKLPLYFANALNVSSIAT